MRKIMFLLFGLFISTANAESINIDWIVDNETYTTTTCNIGDDLILPTAPTKYGYTFQGWLAYTPIEYLESTGTQYIDTGISQHIALSSITQYIGIGFSDFYNARQLSGFNGAKDNYFGITPINNGFVFDIQPSPKGTHIIIKNIKYDLRLEQLSNKTTLIVKLDDTIVDSLVATSYAGFNSSKLYIYRTSGNYTPLYYARIYYYKVLLDNILVRDFIPVLDPADVPCMYDRVTNTYFYNSGTGNFIAGSVIGE